MYELTEKQEAFCREYAKTFNGTQSALKAGYSESGAEVEANRQLKKAKVQERIKELTKATDELYHVDKVKVLKAVEDMAYNGAIESNQRGALDMLMKHLGLYEKDNKREIAGTVITMLPQRRKDK